MIVRGKQRPTAQSRIIVDVLQHRLRYRPTIVRARATSHLVQDDKAATGGAAQDMSRLHHLHHKRALSARQIVLSTDPRENAISNSDARMSGTAYGAVVLHVSPEAAAGGPLALVRDGDRIELDTKGRKLNLRVDDAELARRKVQWKPPAKPDRGYHRLWVDTVTQAERGCDFDFLIGK